MDVATNDNLKKELINRTRLESVSNLAWTVNLGHAIIDNMVVRPNERITTDYLAQLESFDSRK